MYVSQKALIERAAKLERYARRKGVDLADEPGCPGPVARIGRLATRLGIDLRLAFDMERDFSEPGDASLH